MRLLAELTDYFERFMHPREETPELTPEERLKQTAGQLGASLSELGQTLQEHPELAPEVAARVDAAALEKQAMDERRERMRQAILEAHRKLETGLDEAALRELDEGMKAVVPHMEECVGGEIAQRITSYSLNRLFQEVGILSWSQLLQKLERQQLRWPAPAGLSPSATPAEIEQATVRNRLVDGEAFLGKSPEQVRELMQGVVKVWRSAYPLEDSPLWQETLFQGVAAGIRARLFLRAVRATQQDPALVSTIQSLLERELAATREVLARGLQSSDELNRILAETDRLCRQQVPDLVWKLVEPVLRTD